MDTVIAAQAALAHLNDNGADALYIQHTRALVAKALEQHYAAQDSQGQLYSRSSASRVASSTAANRVVANINNCPPLEPRATQSTNNPVELHPPRAMVAANGQPINTRMHIMNDQAWRERNHLDANFRYGQPCQSAFARVGPVCFGPMIRGEPYPVGFKGPRDIEKYNTSNDPAV
jgi:hypothetical protein